MKKDINLQLFAEENIIVAGDLEPAISIDHTNRIATSITQLQEILGITEMKPMSEGTTVNIYRTTQVNTPEPVAEGEVIPLTKVKREKVRTIELENHPVRKSTTHRAIQAIGYNRAINETDAKVISNMQKRIKNDFFDVMLAGEGTATGTNLQNTLANSWAALTKFHEDEDVTPVYLVSVDDVASYIGETGVQMAQAFGFSYLKNFLGLGTVIVSPRVTKGKVVAVAKENLNGVFVPMNTGDVGKAFGLTSDSTGFVGMTHSVKTENASIETLIMAVVVFYPELIDGVIVGTISSTGA